MNGDGARRDPRQTVIGREPERVELQQFVEDGEGSVCLVIWGDVGVGKTTLWEEGLQLARARDRVVLSTRASQAEAGLSFAGLADLVEGIDQDILARLPPPQLDALEVATRKRSPAGVVPDRFAIFTGFLAALRALSADANVLVGLDDLLWVDQASAEAIVFAARRLSGGRVKFLVTRRPEARSELERALPPAGVKQVAIGPLSYGAVGRLLSERLGPALPRRIIRQVHETSGGNPLFALELTRLLAKGRIPDTGADLPLPDLVEDVFGSRVRSLTGTVRRALLATSLSAGITEPELTGLLDRQTLEDAIASGILVIERSRVRPSHPMLAAAVRRDSSAHERRALHVELARLLTEPTLRARHLALAADPPDAGVAAIVASAAEVASQRGDVHEAQELGALALQFTPLNAANRADRVLALAQFHLRAGDMVSLASFLTVNMEELPHGRPRALAHLMLARAALGNESEPRLELALSEGAEDSHVRGQALALKALFLTITQVERLDYADGLVREAHAAARTAGAEVERLALVADSWVHVMRGRPTDELLQAVSAHQGGDSAVDGQIQRALGVRHAFRGELDRARAIFEQILEGSDERGDLRTILQMHLQRCELELRAGNVRRAEKLIEEFDHTLQGEVSIQEIRIMSTRLCALAAAVAGAPEAAQRWAALVLATDCPIALGWDRLEAIRAIGIAALLAHDVDGALQNLRTVWEHTRREHVDDPGVFPVASDLVEALILVSERDEASLVEEDLRRRSMEQDHPWGLVTAKRCAAEILLAAGYRDDAAVELEEAADEYGRLGLGFDRARTLLCLGRIQRRHKKRAAACVSLQAAADLFEQGGSPGWAGEARKELARVSGRRTTSADELTPSELQVVTLAARGRSNKEIAGELFVSVSNVESHLSHAYAKLGVNTRSELAGRLVPANLQ